MTVASVTTTRSEQSPSRREVWWLLALCVLALALRLPNLSRSLFNDETVSFALAQRDFGHMLGLFGYEANGTPYPLLLWPVTRIFGTSVEVLRAPALIVGIASVPAMWWAVRGILAERGVALLAAALLALNPMAVWYSQVARSYALVVLGACLAIGALARTVERPERRGMWAVYVLATALLAYSDLLAPAILLPAELLLAWRAGRDGLRRTLAALVAAGVLCVPLLVAAIVSLGRRDALYWLPKLDRGLVETGLQEFSGGYSGVTAVRWLTLLALVALLAGAAIALRRRRAERSSGWSREAGELLVAFAWGVLPPVLLLVVSAKFAVFWPRYAIVALPGLCALAAVSARTLVAASGTVARSFAAGAVLVLVLAGGYADGRQASATQQDWPPVMSWLRAERSAGEPIVLDNVLMLPSMGYYDPGLREGGKLVVWEWRDTPLPAGVHGFKDPTGYGRAANGPPSVALVRRLAREGRGSLWLVFGEVDADEQGRPAEMAAVRWVRSRCSVQRRVSTGVEVLRARGCRA